MLTTLGPLVLVVALVLLTAGHLLYPLFLVVVAPRAGAAPPASPPAGALPPVTVIVAFVNEPAPMVVGRIRNALDADGVTVDVIAVADGAGSDLVEEVRELIQDAPRVRVVALPRRSGKSSAQNAAAALARGEILVFTDAATRFAPPTVGHLAAALQDPAVGCAVGRLDYEGGGAEDGYWRLETRLKTLESAWSGLVGATGAVYALRRSEYVVVPPGAQSDLVEPLLIHLLHGLPTRFVPDAVALEPVPRGLATAFRRKRRIFARAWSSLPLVLPALDPRRHPRLALAMTGHKLLRWGAAPLVLAALAGAWATPGLASTAAAALAALALVTVAGAHPRSPAPLALGAHWVVTVAAQAAALWDLLRGADLSAWTPEPTLF